MTNDDEPTCHMCGDAWGLRPFNLRVRARGEVAWSWSYACPSCWQRLRPELREPDDGRGVTAPTLFDQGGARPNAGRPAKGAAVVEPEKNQGAVGTLIKRGTNQAEYKTARVKREESALDLGPLFALAKGQQSCT